ncbi:13654_t:CDS:2, partial [Funneliformis mosseae]
HRIAMSELPDLTFVTAIISSIINCPVKTYDECIAEGRSSKNDPALTYSGKIEIDEDNSKIDEDNEIDERSRTYHHHQTSQFLSKPLEDHRTLKSYNINQNDRGVINYFVLNNQFFDPYNNWNLTDIKMGKNYIHGGRVYAPPYGWNRIRLNTRRVRAEITVIRGQEQTKQQFTKYGKGIYSTTDIKYAEQYAIKRRNQILHNNDRYLYVFQNRVNPRDLEDRGIEWITKKSNNIRPYGLCIKRYY